MKVYQPYDLKSTLRCEFEVGKNQLQNFHALESDWREIFHWVMSANGKLPSLPYGTIMSLQFCWIFVIKI